MEPWYLCFIDSDVWFECMCITFLSEWFKLCLADIHDTPDYLLTTAFHVINMEGFSFNNMVCYNIVISRNITLRLMAYEPHCVH